MFPIGTRMKYWNNWGVKPQVVKVYLRLTKIKSLHVTWLIQGYHYLKSFKNIIFAGFLKAHIAEPVKEVHSLIMYEKVCENPFEGTEISLWLVISGNVKHELRFASWEFRYTSYEVKFTCYEFKSTSYEFESTSYEFEFTS